MRRAAVVCFCTMLVGSMSAVGQGGPGAGESPKAPEVSLVIAIPVDYEAQIHGSLVLAESIRSFGSSLSGVPVRIYVPRPLRPSVSAHGEKIARLQVEVREVDVPREAWRYVLGGKPFAAAQAEREAADAAYLALLAPNTIVLRAPEAFLLPAGKQLGYSTVHHQNVGSLKSEPPDELWSRVYAVLGVSEDAVFTNDTLADGKTVRFYFNAGSFVVRPQRGLLQAWAESFQKLIQDAELAKLCAEGPRNIFLHQAALAGACLARLREADTVELPHTYSYPLFFERFHGGLLTFDSLADVVTMRYEFRFQDLPERWEEQVTAPPGVLSWIKERLATTPPP